MSQVIINQAGPLPISAKVTWPSDRTVLVAVTGSAFTKQPSALMAVNLHIASTLMGTLNMGINAAGTHMALPTGYFAPAGVIGDTTVELTAANGSTLTDSNDIFTVSLIY